VLIAKALSTSFRSSGFGTHFHKAPAWLRRRNASPPVGKGVARPIAFTAEHLDNVLGETLFDFVMPE
jgi:hypothetical protein